ncbi:MAG: hypothetical protein HUK21_09635 [Fibrobacteraceae bacterium]|nr:hypothetical protein [Fibrobacteraceae bacterium]MCF0216720.1 hypothetical protein [Fibrobacteraceae bacterium]
MKKIILAIAALFIAFLVACSSDFGSGTSLNSDESIITVPSSHDAADFDESAIESSEDSEDEEDSPASSSSTDAGSSSNAKK